MAYMTSQWSGSEIFPVEGFHHIEFYVGNAKQASHFYQSAFGFEPYAYAGPETGCKDKVSYVLKQNCIFFILTTPLSSRHPIADWLKKHGDGVADIALQVPHVKEAFYQAMANGGIEAWPPRESHDENGSFWSAGIRTYGDTVHTLTHRSEYRGIWAPGYVPLKSPSVPAEKGLLTHIDHVVGNVPRSEMDTWTKYYEKVFGLGHFIRFDETDISTQYSALKSNVVRSKNWQVKLPINEPAKGLKKSQIEEFLDYYEGPGVQHIALASDQIIDSVTHLRNNGVAFLSAPQAYYDHLPIRVGSIEENLTKIKELSILVDRDEQGYLLQIFTQPVEDRPTFFFEIIQRKGAMGFGQGNFQALFESIEKEQALRGNL